MFFVITTVVPIVLKLLVILGIALASYFFGWEKLRDNVDSLDNTHNKYGQFVSFLIIPIILVYLLFLRSSTPETTYILPQ